MIRNRFLQNTLISVAALVGLAGSIALLTPDAEARSFGRASSFSAPRASSFSASRSSSFSASRSSSYSQRLSIQRATRPVSITPAPKIAPAPSIAPTVRPVSKPVYTSRPKTIVRQTYVYQPSTPRPSFVSNNAGWMAFAGLAAYMALSDDDRAAYDRPPTGDLAKLSYTELARLVTQDDTITMAEIGVLREWRRLTGNPLEVK